MPPIRFVDLTRHSFLLRQRLPLPAPERRQRRARVNRQWVWRVALFLAAPIGWAIGYWAVWP